MHTLCEQPCFVEVEVNVTLTFHGYSEFCYIVSNLSVLFCLSFLPDAWIRLRNSLHRPLSYQLLSWRNKPLEKFSAHTLFFTCHLSPSYDSSKNFFLWGGGVGAGLAEIIICLLGSCEQLVGTWWHAVQHDYFMKTVRVIMMYFDEIVFTITSITYKTCKGTSSN